MPPALRSRGRGLHRVAARTPLLETRLNGIAPHRQGKVRDIYDVGDALLLVATDRISAFDYVLGSGIPDKGKVLTQLSAFWFEHTRSIVPNHVLATDVRDFPADLRRHADVLAGRSMLVRKTTPVPIECVARGYLSGSGWKDYQATGAVCGVALPPGLRESDRLPEPIFTPATKATSGHDVNISEAEAGRLVGDDLVATLRDLTLALYAVRRRARGELRHHPGRHQVRVRPDRRRASIILIDEVMTPDSSRYWPRDRVQARAARSRASTSSSCATTSSRSAGTSSRRCRRCPTTSWQRTREKYVEAFRRLTGQGTRVMATARATRTAG